MTALDTHTLTQSQYNPHTPQSGPQHPLHASSPDSAITSCFNLNPILALLSLTLVSLDDDYNDDDDDDDDDANDEKKQQ